jgi:CRP-like cAMP-binding protein
VNSISHDVAVSAISIKRGETLTFAGGVGPVWRVTHGVFKLESYEGENCALIQLAKPGDLIGVEVLCHKAYAYTVRAIVDAEVEIHLASHAHSDPSILVQAFLQQQRQTFDMYKLRTGSISTRLSYLMSLLKYRLDGEQANIQRTDLPTLKDIAKVIDATVETVCRDLNDLIPARTQAKSKKKLISNWSQAATVSLAEIMPA